MSNNPQLLAVAVFPCHHSPVESRLLQTECLSHHYRVVYLSLLLAVSLLISNSLLHQVDSNPHLASLQDNLVIRKGQDKFRGLSRNVDWGGMVKIGQYGVSGIWS